MKSSPIKTFIQIKLCCNEEYLRYINYIDIIVENSTKSVSSFWVTTIRSKIESYRLLRFD